MALAFALSCLCGCGADVGDRYGDLAQSEQRIVGGDVATGGVYDAVGSVHLGGARMLGCSATLVRSDAVLTAAHCVAGRPPGDLSVQFAGTTSLTPDSEYIPVVEVVVHPNYSNQQLANDLAVLRLAFDVGVAPIPTLPAALSVGAGDVGTLAIDIVGFGRDDAGAIGTRRRKTLVVGSIGCAVTGCPVDSSQTDERLFAYVQSTGGPCILDSGGPAFATRGGTTYVAGVTADGDVNCYLWGVSTSIGLYESWLVGVLGALPMDASVPDASVPDASVPDASIPDASVPDASVPDASVPDASVPDASVPDAGVPDGSVPDAGVPDGGMFDAGAADGGMSDASVPDGGSVDPTMPDAGGSDDGRMDGDAGAQADAGDDSKLDGPNAGDANLGGSCGIGASSSASSIWVAMLFASLWVSFRRRQRMAPLA